jgi:glycosyltransferase involved in cell wall biosynthesis
MPPKISVCLMVRDEEQMLEGALQSARACPWCDELLVVDTGSCDQSPAIARRWADRVLDHPWKDFRANRIALTQEARNDWVFLLDADEEISPELAREISSLPIRTFEEASVVSMPRRTFVLGRHVRIWDPDRVTRLFDRRRIKWSENTYHDERYPQEGYVRRLSRPILHRRNRFEWSTYFDGPRLDKRIDAQARELIRNGRKCGVWELWIHPLGAFLKYYFLRGGFREGAFGLIVAQRAMVGAQLKWARVWHLQTARELGAGIDQLASDSLPDVVPSAEQRLPAA